MHICSSKIVKKCIWKHIVLLRINKIWDILINLKNLLDFKNFIISFYTRTYMYDKWWHSMTNDVNKWKLEILVDGNHIK